MTLPRPYIPLEIRAAVARQQAFAAGVYPRCNIAAWPYTAQLRELLHVLFGDDKPHLDHDPPLAWRKKIRNRNGDIIRYMPDANDPRFLIYRNADDHRLKTNVRGDGAQHPDRVLIKKIRRIERPRHKIKRKWPSRPFQSRGKKNAFNTRVSIKPRSMRIPPPSR
jgi:hypothetical protein